MIASLSATNFTSQRITICAEAKRSYVLVDFPVLYLTFNYKKLQKLIRLMTMGWMILVKYRDDTKHAQSVGSIHVESYSDARSSETCGAKICPAGVGYYTQIAAYRVELNRQDLQKVIVELKKIRWAMVKK